MKENDYKKELHRLHDPTRQNLIELSDWAVKQALPWLWAELAGILGKKKVVPLQAHDAIRQGLVQLEWTRCPDKAA